MFVRVRAEDVDKIASLATARGLEHYIHPFGEGYDDWVTFQFTSPKSSKAFERLCQENNVTVDGKQVIRRMVDSVVGDGMTAQDVIEQMTNGMKNALHRNGPKFKCKECGAPIPKYPGSYPKKCPDCGGELECPRCDDDD